LVSLCDRAGWNLYGGTINSQSDLCASCLQACVSHRQGPCLIYFFVLRIQYRVWVLVMAGKCLLVITSSLWQVFQTPVLIWSLKWTGSGKLYNLPKTTQVEWCNLYLNLALALNHYILLPFLRNYYSGLRLHWTPYLGTILVELSTLMACNDALP
jgi:hypothetical protein